MDEVWRSGIADNGQGWVWRQGAGKGYPFAYRTRAELALAADRMKNRDNADREIFLSCVLPAELIATDTKEN